MANASLHDALALRPHNGGRGVRFTVTDTASTPVNVPFSSDTVHDETLRVRIVNTGSVNICVALQGTADRNCMVLIPSLPEVFTVPYSPNGVTISAITESVSVTSAVSVVAGRGY